MSALGLLILDETTTSRGGHDDDLDHLFCCCSPDLALCGTDISDEPVCEDDEDQDNPCVVCVDLEAAICSRCGFGLSGPCACGRCGESS